MTILGIETSCDETALALIEARGHGDGLEYKVMASLVHSQASLHSAYGGVYPNLAKREHGKNLVPLLHELIIRSGVAVDASPLDLSAAIERYRTEVGPQNPELFESFSGAGFLRSKPRIDAIAVTEGPGLEPALWVGIVFARMLADIWGVPVMPIDHMEGHILGSLLPSDSADGTWRNLHPLPLPSVALLISGGHTELVRVGALGSYSVMGSTKDDAVGEAFDKTARLLGLPYPGGPYVSELAQKAEEEGIQAPVKLPRPMKGSGDLNFSFSGLKTAVLYAVRAAPKDQQGELDERWKKGLCREFEDAVRETLDAKLRKALDLSGARSIIVGGGVSANRGLRHIFENTASEYGIPVFLPSRHIAGDNALMIAIAGALHRGDIADEKAEPIRARGTKRIGSAE